MWQHFRYQITDVPNFELECLVWSVRPYESAFPLLLNHVQEFRSICVLADRETRSHLPTKTMTRAWLEWDAETTFSIHKTRDVRIQIHRQGSGPACYGILRFHPEGLNLWVVTGIRLLDGSYPRYYPRPSSAGRASPIWAGWMERNHFRPGQFNYPTRNFA